MFLTALKTIVQEAVQATFDGEYPVGQFRNVWVSIEYPMEQAGWPGIWVDFTPTTDLQVAGIGHVEYTAPDEDGARRKVLRWRYAGMVQITCVALTSLERDRLVDEMVKVLAFGLENPARAEFRRRIEHNDLIGMTLQWDRFNLASKAETPGTPWGTDEVMYEQTISVDCQGEFTSDGSFEALVPLSAVVVYDTPAGGTEPPQAGGDDWQ